MCDHTHDHHDHAVNSDDEVQQTKLDMMAHGHTGCEHHIDEEIKSARLTRHDKRRFTDKYIAPLVTRRVFKLDTTGASHTTWSCSIPGHDTGCDCAHDEPLSDDDDGDSDNEGRDERRDGDDRDAIDRDEEAEILAKMRAQRLARLQVQQQDDKMLSNEWIQKCRLIKWSELRPTLFARGPPVICAMIDARDVGRAISAALGHSAARYASFTFISCVVPEDKLALSDEFGWALTYLSKLPDLVCYDNGVYVGHHGSLELTAGNSLRALFSETQKWVETIMGKVKRGSSIAHKVEENTESQDEAEDSKNNNITHSTHDRRKREQALKLNQRHPENTKDLASLSLKQTPIFDDSDSDFEAPSRPGGLTMRLGNKKRNPTQSVSNVIQRIVYRQYSSDDDYVTD
eukprot:m.130304 g.130304  ORF g.130304 m.130304 type:complete len:401 (-) comp29471_c0_seq1:62-1264(-)